MALRLRRDVQKASYYVWFLGAEEAKGLRGARVINSALPYLIDRARGQDPLKVTLQISHKGIKILQGSSKHFIPHSAITSSVQTDDIVACVLLLYNPATKCPLHVHAYRCDSESTADALHQQLQILINRAENQKRFEELETRLGILPPIPTSESTSVAHSHNESRNSSKSPYQPQPQQPMRRHETSPKRFSSSLGSDTGNSTRESECSEEHIGSSPMSHSPSNAKPPALVQQNNELFDSLAAELRAKLNGNGPPLLLPPRDYDTVHRSKGNLAAIELRRCRNSLIVGGATTASKAPQQPLDTTTAKQASKQVSSRGSSGIGSDLAPSPERQELNSSSDDEHWSNEADNSVIALKPSQIAMERSAPIVPHQQQLNRRKVIPPPEDSYLRDLPARPYREKVSSTPIDRPLRSKTPSSVASWSKEDDIKPIIVRPTDYDAKFNRVLQTEHKKDQYYRRETELNDKDHPKLRDTDKYNEINRLLNKKLSLERASPDPRYKHKMAEELDDLDDSDPSSDRDQLPASVHESSSYRKDNLTDKQKFIEYSAKRQPNSYAAEEVQRYGGRQRYVDPADLPFEQPQPTTATHHKYAALHRGAHTQEERRDVGHRTAERHGERKREAVEVKDPRRHSRERGREYERDHYSRSNERNPYREPESIPYIQSMEKMMKSSAMRYKSFEGDIDDPRPKDESHIKVSQRSKSYQKREEDVEELNADRDYNYQRSRGHGYAASASSHATPKERFADVTDKFRAMERSGSRFNLKDERDSMEYKQRRRHGSVEGDSPRVYEDWSDEERRLAGSPPPSVVQSRPRSRDRHWEERAKAKAHHGRYESPPAREERNHQPRSVERPRDRDRDHARKIPREYVKEHGRREYSPEPDHRRPGYAGARAMEKQGAPHVTTAQPAPSSAAGGVPISNAKNNLPNLTKGYRHSYAEPVFARSGGRVGLAAVNPY